MQRFLRLALAVSSAIVAMLALPTVGRAQGVTTGGIAGTVMDSAGGVLAGATVRITSPSTGFSRITTTRENGRYVVSGLETGTYRVAVAAIGFGPQAREGVRVLLSQTARADFTMGRQAVTLQEIVTTAAAASSEFAPTRTGAQTFISDSSVRRLPTLNRLLQDFVRLTPQVVTNPAPANAGEVSIAGQNYRYNAIQVDGTTQNDKFGLSDTGELGGQANGRGISLEAVKEYQVVVSPYNVTLGGFTGGLISAVTKNGTNKFAGTGFYTTRNQDLVPNVPLYSGAKFLRRQYGGSLGGPIIKGKLHFFAAAEGTSANQPAFGPYIGQPQDAAQQLRVDQALVDRFNAALAQYGIDGGSGGQEFNKNPITNLVGRLDWAVSSKNRVVLRGVACLRGKVSAVHPGFFGLEVTSRVGRECRRFSWLLKRGDVTPRPESASPSQGSASSRNTGPTPPSMRRAWRTANRADRHALQHPATGAPGRVRQPHAGNWWSLPPTYGSCCGIHER